MLLRVDGNAVNRPLRFIPGDRLGSYEILSVLGAGGMGDVYRGTDTILKRQVALKVLPSEVADSRERVARFQREAEVLASLNHPNIAHLYGIEKSNGTLALVMELVEGPTLADRIAKGPIPLDEALPIARQIAEALEAAHEQGIIHRDLKPANIKVRDDGTVKVLDFGLAKAMEPLASGTSSAALTNSPTITSPALMTAVGMLIGTAAYMAPEQAKGKPADKRSDVWAFGCVLYEMVTGRSVFGAETVSETIAAILTRAPDWSTLPKATPPMVRAVLERCLDKNPRDRLRDIGEARIQLDRTESHRLDQSPSRPSAWAWALIAILFAGGAGAAAARWWTGRDAGGPPAAVIRFPIYAPEGTIFSTSNAARFGISPDGTRIAMVVQSAPTGSTRLRVETLDGMTRTDLPGTSGVVGSPFWAPDSTQVAFFAEGKLRVVGLDGANQRVICDLPGRINIGSTWTGTWDQGVILFPGGIGQPLFRVSAAGGSAAPATKVTSGETHYQPAFLPDGRHFTFLSSKGVAGVTSAWVGSLNGEDPTALWKGGSDGSAGTPGGGGRVLYDRGHLIFVRDGSLTVQPFDLRSFAFAGEPRTVGEPTSFGSTPTLSLSRTGLLVYSTGLTPDRQFLWVDRTGREVERIAQPEPWGNFDLSPDGRQIVTSRSRQGLSGEIWTIDLARGVPTRLTPGEAGDGSPVWAPDGLTIAFTRGVSREAMTIPASGGSPSTVLQMSGGVILDDWSPDGRFLSFNQDPAIMAVPLDRNDHKPFVIVDTKNASVDESHFSPDSKWIAYTSNESGMWQVYVSPFPPTGARWQMSSDGGTEPRWRGDSRELFYLDLEGRMMHVNVRLGATPTFDPPQLLFDARISVNPRQDHFAVTSDGQRFVLRRQLATGGQMPLTAVVNWSGLLDPPEDRR